MATNAAFRAFFQHEVIGLNEETAREIVVQHGINTMKVLAGLTHQGVMELASLIRKTKVTGIAPAPDRTMTFPAGSVRKIWMAGVIAKNMERVSRTVVPADLREVMRDADRLDMHEQQIKIEKDHDNTHGEYYFSPLTEKTLHEKGFKAWDENIRRALEDIRGEASGAPLAYLIRPDIHPAPEADEDEDDFMTFDAQLIARKPIVKSARRNATEAECEEAGPSWMRPEVNSDNRKFHDLLLKSVEGTSMRVHVEPTMATKDGRRAYFLLRRNLQTAHEVERKSRENMSKLRSLTWTKDTHTWTFDKYRANHKLCHTTQNKLHREHGYQDILPRDKVNLFLEGIRNPEFNAVIISVKDNPALAEDFEAAQERICNFKSLLDSRLNKSQRYVAAMYGGGRGRGGNGHGGFGRGGGRGDGTGRGSGGRGGGGRGNDHGRRRSQYRRTHKTSKGGAALDGCKLSDGSWNVDAIMDGQRDQDARRQTHITKMYYPEVEWKKLEPLERRKVFLNRMDAGSDKSGQTQPVPANVSVTSASNASSISSLESSVDKLNKTVKVLIDVHNDKMREISNLKRAADKAGLYRGLSESDDSSIFDDNSCSEDNIRLRLKANRPKKRSQREHPALARQSGNPRRDS